jgi:hypothetical protein
MWRTWGLAASAHRSPGPDTAKIRFKCSRQPGPGAPARFLVSRRDETPGCASSYESGAGMPSLLDPLPANTGQGKYLVVPLSYERNGLISRPFRDNAGQWTRILACHCFKRNPLEGKTATFFAGRRAPPPAPTLGVDQRCVCRRNSVSNLLTSRGCSCCTQ